MKQIIIIFIAMLFVGCTSKVDRFELIEMKKRTAHYDDCNLEIKYDRDIIEIKWIVSRTLNKSENTIALEKTDDGYVFLESNSNRVFNRALKGQKILSFNNSYYSSTDVYKVLDEVNNISVLNYSISDNNYVAVISQYYRPSYKIKLYYDNQFHIKQVDLMLGADEFIFKSTFIKELEKKPEEYSPKVLKLFEEVKRDSLNFAKEHKIFEIE